MDNDFSTHCVTSIAGMHSPNYYAFCACLHTCIGTCLGLCYQAMQLCALLIGKRCVNRRPATAHFVVMCLLAFAFSWNIVSRTLPLCFLWHAVAMMLDLQTNAAPTLEIQHHIVRLVLFACLGHYLER